MTGAYNLMTKRSPEAYTYSVGKRKMYVSFPKLQPSLSRRHQTGKNYFIRTVKKIIK